jgi:hypothetical protein
MRRLAAREAGQPSFFAPAVLDGQAEYEAGAEIGNVGPGAGVKGIALLGVEAVDLGFEGEGGGVVGGIRFLGGLLFSGRLRLPGGSSSFGGHQGSSGWDDFRTNVRYFSG